MKALIVFAIFYQSHSHNAALIKKLDSMFVEDQRWRIEIMKIRNNEKSVYDEATINRMWSKSDSLNEVEAKRIVDKYGYPGYDLVGEVGSNHFWAIVQHCDDDV